MWRRENWLMAMKLRPSQIIARRCHDKARSSTWYRSHTCGCVVPGCTRKLSQASHAKQACSSRLAWVYAVLAHHFPSTAPHDQHVWSVLMHGVGPQLLHVPKGLPLSSSTVTVPPPLVQHWSLASQTAASLIWSNTIHPMKVQTKTLQPPP
jgi:hypothetical protein